LKTPQTGKKMRVYYVGVGLLLLWILLPVFVKSVLYRGIDLFYAPVESLASKGGQMQDYWALRLQSKNRLIEAYRDLSRKQAHDRMKLNQLNSINLYVNRLERLLSMSPIRDHQATYARVIRRDTNAWFESIVIDKGKRDGVQTGQAVVFINGLAGRVGEVRDRVAHVTLESSPLFRITVNTPNDDRPISLSGKGQLAWAPLTATAHHIPQDIVADEENPLQLFTSGLGGGLPAGILVGELVSVEPELEGLFKKGDVRLSEELNSLREVAVLIPLSLGN
jgi:cell shape-determining protein MreC